MYGHFLKPYKKIWDNESMSESQLPPADNPEVPSSSTPTKSGGDPAKTKEPAHEKAAERKKANITAWLIIGAIALVLGVVLYMYVSTVLPVWWANTIGGQVDKNLASGVLLGLFYGFVFTFVPLLILWQIRRPRIRWPMKIVLIVIAVLVAGPNLITLGIHTGTNQAAHNAQRILGTEATWFGAWTAWGAIIAAIVFVVLVVSVWQYRRRGRRVKLLEAQK